MPRIHFLGRRSVWTLYNVMRSLQWGDVKKKKKSTFEVKVVTPNGGFT